MAKVVELGLGAIASGPELHAVLSRSFGFPDYYGSNWDAFDECIGEFFELCNGSAVVRCRGVDRLREQLPREAQFLERALDELSALSPAWRVERDA